MPAARSETVAASIKSVIAMAEGHLDTLVYNLDFNLDKALV